MFNSVRPHRRQPTRLPHPWDSPGKNTGVDCHFLLQHMKVKSLSHVRLLVTPWTAAYQAPPSMGFSGQEQQEQQCLTSIRNANSTESEGFPGGSVLKNLPDNAGDVGFIPGSGRFPGERNGNTLQYSCLRNPMDREAWQATVHGVTKSQTQLSD